MDTLQLARQSQSKKLGTIGGRHDGELNTGSVSCSFQEGNPCSFNSLNGCRGGAQRRSALFFQQAPGWSYAQQVSIHTCPPPISALKAWLKETASFDPGHGHLLLEQQHPPDANLLGALRAYFESAHLDARKIFHEFASIDLHPDATEDNYHARYPSCLPSRARRGLFGEVLAGLTTQSYTFIGKHQWIVPVFLFRHHEDAKLYLFDLVSNPKVRRQVMGRQGSDFIAIALDANGNLSRLLVGEAKWRETVTQAVIDNLMLGAWTENPDGSGQKVRSGTGIYNALNNSSPIPSGLRQLQRILCELAQEKYSAAIVSIDKALALRAKKPFPRTDLVLIACNRGKGRASGKAFLPKSSIPSSELKTGRDLQIVEIVLEDGGNLIDQLYGNLWPGNEHVAA